MKKLLIIVGMILMLVIGWVMALSNAMPSAENSAQVESYIRFADEQRALGAYGSAINYYKAAVKQEDTAAHRHLLADTYLEAGLIESYQEELETIVSVHPTDAEGYVKLATFYHERGSYSSCVEVALSANKNGCLTEELREMYFDALYRYTIISDSFDEAYNYYTSYALVKVGETYRYVDTAMNYVLGEYSWADNCLGTVVGVFDDAEQASFYSVSGLKYVDGAEEYEKVWSYSENLALAKKADGYYYLNARYSEVFGPFEEATSFASGIAAVKENGVWHLINQSGAKVGESTFTQIAINEDNLCSYGGVVFAGNGAGYDMYGTDGKLIKQCGFADARPFFTGDYTAVKVGALWGFVDKTGNLVLEAQYEDAKPFGNGVGAVKADGLWGYVNHSGRMVIAPTFDDAGCFSSGKIAPVKIDDLWVYIQLNN
ncbi:MAG: WG repeat-containing protein [Lachnospiraceae bacterium]|nr:WG repeat-containing protein [Lachnospiraceae bacterium]